MEVQCPVLAHAYWESSDFVEGSIYRIKANSHMWYEPGGKVYVKIGLYTASLVQFRLWVNVRMNRSVK